MRFGDESDLFGREKDDSFKGSIGNIYQTYGGGMCTNPWRKKRQICCTL